MNQRWCRIRTLLPGAIQRSRLLLLRVVEVFLHPRTRHNHVAYATGLRLALEVCGDCFSSTRGPARVPSAVDSVGRPHAAEIPWACGMSLVPASDRACGSVNQRWCRIRTLPGAIQRSQLRLLRVAEVFLHTSSYETQPCSLRYRPAFPCYGKSTDFCRARRSRRGSSTWCTGCSVSMEPRVPWWCAAAARRRRAAGAFAYRRSSLSSARSSSREEVSATAERMCER